MRVEVLVVSDCPSAEAACEAVNQAARLVGLEELEVTVTVIDTDEQAQRRGFLGSPTFLIDGTNPFAPPGAAALACRLYPTPPARQALLKSAAWPMRWSGRVAAQPPRAPDR